MKTIDPSKYTTAAEAAREIDAKRQTLDAAMRRRDNPLEVAELFGGKLIVSIASARKWSKLERKTGPKPQGKS